MDNAVAGLFLAAGILLLTAGALGIALLAQAMVARFRARAVVDAVARGHQAHVARAGIVAAGAPMHASSGDAGRALAPPALRLVWSSQAINPDPDDPSARSPPRRALSLHARRTRDAGGAA